MDLTPYFFDTANLITNLLNLLVVAVGLFFAGRQLKLGRKVHQETLRWHRMVSTKEALEQRPQLELDKISTTLSYPNNTAPFSANEVYESVEKVPGLLSQIKRLLNYYERISRNIQIGLYDEEIVKMARKRAIIRCFRSFEEFIMKYRTEQAAPNAWVELQRIAERWDTADTQSELQVEK